MVLVRSAILLTLSFVLTAGACAQDYPTRPVRLVVPLTAGSSIDIVARGVASVLAKTWEQPVTVENRPGAGGTIAAAYVAKAPPDGYTLFVSSSGHASNPSLYPNLPYDTQKDFVDIAPMAKAAQVLVVGSSTGIRTLSDLVSLAKTTPGGLTYASAGVGTGTHFTAERFRLATGVQARHVAYRGGVEAMTDVVAGRVTYWFPSVALALPMIRDGRINPLAVTTRTRTPLLPEVPTLMELGLAGFDDALWFGISAPAGTPPSIVASIARNVSAAVDTPTVSALLQANAAEPLHLSPADYSRLMRSEMDSAARVVKSAGIKLQ